MVRDELRERFRHYAKQMTLFDQRLEGMRQAFPQVESLVDIHGIGLYSALLIVAEIGEVERFRSAKQVGAYSGLTSRVHQSGGHCYQGSITRQGSPWLRWVLVQAAMKAETLAAMAARARQPGRLKEPCRFAHRHGCVWPAKGTSGKKLPLPVMIGHCGR